MTTQNFKRLAWRKKQAHKRTVKLLGAMFLLIFALFVIPAIACSVDNPSDTVAASTLAISTAGMAIGGMAIVGDVYDANDRAAAGEQISYKLYFVALDQIDPAVAFPKPNANREIGSIPLKAGEKMHFFETHIAPTYDGKGEKGDFNSAYTNTLVAAMSGNADALLKFYEEFTGCKFIIIFQKNDTGEYYIIGDDLKPMVLKTSEHANNKEKCGMTFTFENKSYVQPNKYVGVIARTEPVTLAAGATVLATVSGNNEYFIPNAADAAAPITTISGLTANDKGRTITLRGAGSDKAMTIEDGACFVLDGGATWTAKAGSVLTLRVLDPNRLVEIGGTRIQTI